MRLPLELDRIGLKFPASETRSEGRAAVAGGTEDAGEAKVEGEWLRGSAVAGRAQTRSGAMGGGAVVTLPCEASSRPGRRDACTV
jgi:hypothetical protein